MNPDKKQIIRRANELALRAEGRTGTNPMVGALLLRSGRIIAEDRHRGFGQPHAEANVIRKVAEDNDFRDTELAVSLEPCNHQGKTPACTASILEHNIPAVLIGQTDPNPQMSGRSIELLKGQNVRVTGPLPTETGRRVLTPFHIGMTEKRPYIIIKMAVSADGYIGRPGGQIKISHPISDRWVHKIRSRTGGIMAGTNTISNDDPALTARYGNLHQPARIIPDRRGILDENLRIFRSEGRNIIFTSSDRTYPGSEVIRMDDMSLPRLFRRLYEIDIGSVLIEGGTILVSSIVKEGLWDEWIRLRSRTVFLENGVPAPAFPSVSPCFEKRLGTDDWKIIKNPAHR